jgi:GntR family histidine utilization transcriptional repressor
VTAPAGWEAIRAEVLRRIRARVWPPGATIPTEAALAREFGCARATVNRALGDLAGAGVLERRRRAGTRVALHPVRRATLDIPVIRVEVEARGQTHAFRVLKHLTALPPPPVAARLGIAGGTQMRHLLTLHLADGRPFVFEERWLNPAILPDPPPDFTAISANEWLVRNVPYSTGDISFSAEAAAAVEARALGIDAGAAVFVTDRTTWTDGTPVTAVRLVHVPGYRLHTTL